jgi:hypothetical protein
MKMKKLGARAMLGGVTSNGALEKVGIQKPETWQFRDGVDSRVIFGPPLGVHKTEKTPGIYLQQEHPVWGFLRGEKQDLRAQARKCPGLAIQLMNCCLNCQNRGSAAPISWENEQTCFQSF